MNQERISFLDFRKQHDISAAAAETICKKLKLSIVREGTERFIVGSNPFGVSNQYLLKHAVIEFLATGYVEKTSMGDFMEYEIDIPSGKGHIGVHAFDKDVIDKINPSVQRKPNKQPKAVLVPVDRGAELMMRKASAPPAPLQASAGAAGGMDALQVLVAALTEAQKASTPPDTLHPQKTLLEAEEHGFLITTEQLGQLLGMSKGTVASKKSGFRKLGFEFEKMKEGSTTLWKVRRY